MKRILSLIPFPIPQNGLRHTSGKHTLQMLTDISLVIMLETSKTAGMKQDKLLHSSDGLACFDD